jgi:hypothetical protein
VTLRSAGGDEARGGAARRATLATLEPVGGLRTSADLSEARDGFVLKAETVRTKRADAITASAAAFAGAEGARRNTRSEITRVSAHWRHAPTREPLPPAWLPPAAPPPIFPTVFDVHNVPANSGGGNARAPKQASNARHVHALTDVPQQSVIAASLSQLPPGSPPKAPARLHKSRSFR